MPGQRQRARRTGFTLVEVTVSLAVIAIVGVILAQVVAVSLRERARSASRQAALELAANLLESARAEPLHTLNADWAKSQTVPTAMAELLPGGNVLAAVSPDAKALNAKYVSIEIRWREADGMPEESVRLATVIGPREAKIAGGAR